MVRIVLIVLVVFTISCNNVKVKMDSDEDHTYPVLRPNKTFNTAFVMIDGVYNSELMAPFDVFQDTKFRSDTAMEVFTVSHDTNPIISFEGLKLIPDYSFETCPQVDVLVVPSAEHNMGSDLQDSALISFVRQAGQQAKYIVSLCDGAFVLAKAGLMDNLNATTFPGDIEPFKKMFPQIKVHENVSFVHDGKALTSAGGAKSYDVAQYLVERLYGKEAAIENGKGICIDWDLKKLEYVVVD